MIENQNGPGADQASGWGDLSSLKIKPKEERAPEKFSFGIWVWLWVIAFSLLIGGRNMHGPVAGNAPQFVGAIIGSILGGALMSYVVGWIVFRLSSRNLVAGRVGACVIIVMSLLGNMGNRVESRSQQDALAKDLQHSLEQLAAQDQAGRLNPLDARKTVEGDSGELQVFLKNYFNKIISMHNEYLAELDAIGWNALLDAGRIEKDVGMVQSRAIVSRARLTVDKFHGKWLQALNETRAQAQAMANESETKRGFAEGVADSSVAAAAKGELVWASEAEIVDTAGQLVEFLESTRGRWAVNKGQFMFRDDASMNEFNAFVLKINTLVQREDAMQKANMAESLQKMKDAQLH